MIKFLHVADIHLDSPLKGLDQYEGCPADEVRGATRRALENLVRLAIDERVQFVLIAGDVYDGDWKNHNTGLWFGRKMAELADAGIKVVLISGNHDAENRMTGQLRLPPNVRSMATDRAETFHFDDWPIAVHGQGFATQKVTADLAGAFPAANPGCFNVGLLHTSLDGREGHASYAPCTVETLRAKGYGYWALGHVHTREVSGDDACPIVFPGNVQGRHVREPGAKGCMLVEVEGGRAKATFRPLDVLRWGTCRVDASAATNIDDIHVGFDDALGTLLDTSDGLPMAVRVEVVGASKAHSAIVGAAENLIHEFKNSANLNGSGRAWIEQVKLKTRPPSGGVPVDDGPFGEIDRLIAELIGDGPRLVEFASAALADIKKKLPRELVNQDDLDLDSPDYLRALLGQVRPLLDGEFRAIGGVR